MSFPDSPNIDDIYVLGDKTYKWTGKVWNLVSSGAGSFIILRPVYGHSIV